MALTKTTLTGTVDTIKTGFTKVNDIIDDLAAVTTGLGASCIGVYDVADNMAATDVEAALAEIYTDVTDARSLADIFANNPATTTGLTWGYKAGAIRVDHTVTAVVAGTIALTNTATNYIEVNSAGTVSRNTTAFTSGRVPLYTVVCAGGIQTVVTDRRAWFQPLPVPATNGQVLVGSTGADPVLATLTATANETTVANAAGAITIGIADDVIIPTSVTIPNTGLHVLDSNASHDLIIKPGSDLTADKTLTLTTGDADRTVTLSGNPTLSDWFDQEVKAASSPAFTAVTVGNTGLHVLDSNASHDLIIKPGSDLTADRELTIVTGDAALTLDIPSLTGFTAGDILYATAATTLAKLAKGTDGNIIRQASDIPSWAVPIVSGTTVASTSGASIDFTSIPSWVKRITINLAGVSTNGTSQMIVQLGDSGGVEATGYIGATGDNGGAGAYNTGFLAMRSIAAAGVISGRVVLELLDAATFTWTASVNMGRTDGSIVGVGGGYKALTAALDRVRITMVNGTDAFDAGNINILYE